MNSRSAPEYYSALHIQHCSATASTKCSLRFFFSTSIKQVVVFQDERRLDGSPPRKLFIVVAQAEFTDDLFEKHPDVFWNSVHRICFPFFGSCWLGIAIEAKYRGHGRLLRRRTCDSGLKLHQVRYTLFPFTWRRTTPPKSVVRSGRREREGIRELVGIYGNLSARHVGANRGSQFVRRTVVALARFVADRREVFFRIL